MFFQKKAKALSSLQKIHKAVVLRRTDLVLRCSMPSGGVTAHMDGDPVGDNIYDNYRLGFFRKELVLLLKYD